MKELLEHIKEKHILKCPACGKSIDNTINHHAIEAAIAYAISEGMKEKVSKIIDSVLQSSNNEEGL